MGIAVMAIAAFFVGGSVGSFLNVCADRLPEGLSIMGPPSHCPGCERRLKPLEMVPVFSYMALRGRCRTCGSVIPKRTVLVEATAAGIFTYLLLAYGLSPDTLLLALAASLLLLVTVIDLERQLVLNSVLAVGLPLGLAAAPLWSADTREPIWDLGGPPVGVLLDAAAAGGIGLVLFLALFLAFRGGMGMGDVKLAGVIGVWVGTQGLGVALFVTAISGGIVGVFLLVMGIRDRRDPVPYGPFLALGGMTTLLWGHGLWEWYLGLLPPIAL